MPKYKITMTQDCEDEDLHDEDRSQWGENGMDGLVDTFEVNADTEDDALDDFNADQPISDPGNYDIEAEEVSQ